MLARCVLRRLHAVCSAPSALLVCAAAAALLITMSPPSALFAHAARPEAQPAAGAVSGSVSLSAAVAFRSPLGSVVHVSLDYHLDSEDAPSWRGCSVLKLPLDNPRFRTLTRALARAAHGTTLLRIGGTEGDVVVYDLPPGSPPPLAMFWFGANHSCPGEFCLTAQRLADVVAFAEWSGTRIAFGLNARYGWTAGGGWNSSNAEALLAYVVDKGWQERFWGFELGNELDHVLSPAQYASTMRKLRALRDRLHQAWKLIGPDSYTAQYAGAVLREEPGLLDVATFHHYDGWGKDPHLASLMLSTSFYSSHVSAAELMQRLRDSASPSSMIAFGESGPAYQSGGPGVTDRFVSSLWYADALATSSLYGQLGLVRQSLVGGNYGLLGRPEQEFEPHPDYFLALLWSQLMGAAVLQPPFVVLSEPAPDLRPQLRVYAHCAAGVNSSRAASVMVINVHGSLSAQLGLDLDPGVAASAAGVMSVFTLSASDGNPDCLSRTVSLNGRPLSVDASGAPPDLLSMAQELPISRGTHLLAPPRSITFAVLPFDECGTGCASSSEGHSVSLNCPERSSINSIPWASYGTSTSCGVTSKCSSSKSISVVQSMCLGKQSCKLDANNSVFGNPCSGIAKNLRVQYTCARN